MVAYRKLVKNAFLGFSKVATGLLDTALLLHFVLRGKKPYIRGYDPFKWRIIRKELTSPRFSLKGLPQGYGKLVDERIIEYPWLFSRLPSNEQGSLLDAGSALNFELLLRLNTLANKQMFISTLAPENHAFWNKGISYVYDDLRETCFKQDYFDWIVSLSTLEHVGMDNTTYYTDDTSKKEAKGKDYLAVVDEFRRILKPGGTCYLSVPFGAKKRHQWLQVFDAEMVDSLIRTFSPSSFSISFFRYNAEKGWAVSTAEQCADAIYHDYHVDGCSRARPAAAEAVACIEMQK